MTFDVEFPDFPAATMPAIPAGFADESWHNDVCPVFRDGARKLALWIDYADDSLREIPGGARFVLVATDTDETVIASDDWAAIVALIATAS